MDMTICKPFISVGSISCYCEGHMIILLLCLSPDFFNFLNLSYVPTHEIV